ncbi:hypothetical protein D3C87_1737790 [compost metagenome]
MNLIGVKIDRDDAMDTGTRNHVGDELCGNRRAAHVAAILTGIPEVRDHGRDPAGG